MTNCSTDALCRKICRKNEIPKRIPFFLLKYRLQTFHQMFIPGQQLVIGWFMHRIRVIYPFFLYDLITCLFHCVPDPASYTCQYPCAEAAGTLIILCRYNILACGVGFHLTPYRAQCTTATLSMIARTTCSLP